MKSNPDDDSLGDAYVPRDLLDEFPPVAMPIFDTRDYILKLELLIARIRLVEMLAKAPRKATRSLVQHYIWLWRRTVPMPEGTWPHEIKEAFTNDQDIVVLDLTQFKDETD